MRKIVLLLILYSLSLENRGQSLPVVKAQSLKANVMDGNNFRKNYWTIMPEARPDIYYAQRSRHKKKVTFYTDADSISFDVTPGGQYDFIILLNGKDSCYTRISTLRKTYSKDCADCLIASDTIPFTIADDNKIHFYGTINNSPPLDFFFDTGADQIVLYKSGAKKVHLAYDSKIENAGFGGTQSRDVSNRNTLALGKMIWKDEAVMHINSQADEADGIIGFNVFEDKIVEIDFDKGLFIVHDQTFEPGNGYSKLPITYHGTLPQIPVLFSTATTTVTKQLVFDMGAKGSIFLTQEEGNSNGFRQLEKLGSHTSRGVGGGSLKSDYVVLPKLVLGTHALFNVPIDLARNKPEGWEAHNLIGMDVLKRFNIVIDYQQHNIYMKPNSLHDQPYVKDSRSIYIWVGVFTFLALVTLWKANKFFNRA